MIAIQRFYRDQFLGEQLSRIEKDIAVLEQSLGDGHNAEVEAYGVVIDRIRDARIALKVAQGEAEQERQRELAMMRCEQVGSGQCSHGQSLFGTCEDCLELGADQQ